MKKFFVMLVAMLATAVSFVSCSDEEEIDVIESMVGTYEGKASMSVMVNEEENDLGDYATVVKLSRFGETSLNISINTFGKDHYTMPDIDVVGASVKELVDGVALISPTPFEAVFNNVVYEGTIQGSYSNGNLELTMSVKPGKMPMPITAVFKSKAQ
jgi:hypothetical protein